MPHNLEHDKAKAITRALLALRFELPKDKPRMVSVSDAIGELIVVSDEHAKARLYDLIMIEAAREIR